MMNELSTGDSKLKPETSIQLNYLFMFLPSDFEILSTLKRLASGAAGAAASVACTRQKTA